MNKTDLQIQLAKNLQINIDKIKLECDKISKTIENEGVSGNFSINNIIYELATKIYRDCSILGYLKNFDLKLGEENERS
mgnify:FL=1|jgi:hypothetical protein